MEICLFEGMGGGRWACELNACYYLRWAIFSQTSARVEPRSVVKCLHSSRGRGRRIKTREAMTQFR